MKKILIDGRFVGVGESISRYTLEILRGILKLDKKNQYTILLRPQGRKEFHKYFPKKLQATSYKLQAVYLDIPHYSLPEQTKLLKFLNKKKYDLVHFTQFNHPIRYKGKYLITVHDLTLLGHLHRMNTVKRIGFKGVMNSAIKDSKKIITISDFSKKDIIETYGIDPGKVAVTHLGVDKVFNPKVKNLKSEIRKFKKKYKIEGDYILYTGMWKKHKNLLRLFKAFEIITLCNKVNNLQLVLVGKIDKDEPEVLSEISRINKLTANSHKLKAIITTGFIDEDELPVSYAGALAYVIPSLSEGFGLPPLEAMACGTPVLSSKISAMPEILKDTPLYFDPYKINDIAKKIKKIAIDKKLQQKLSKAGIEHVKKYDWQDTAKITLGVYEELLK